MLRLQRISAMDDDTESDLALISYGTETRSSKPHVFVPNPGLDTIPTPKDGAVLQGKTV